MALRHTLSLDVLDTASPHILKILDTSAYSALLPVDCPRLEVWMPGRPEAFVLEDGLPPGFARNLSLVDLGCQAPDAEPLGELPDGLYRFRYSVSPNDQVFTERLHLRTTRLSNRFFAALCRVRLEACEPTADQHQKLHDLRYVRQFIDAAKAKAEVCCAPDQGLEMLAYAGRLLDRLAAGQCLTCR
jgi:hypothetical protein